MIEIVDKSKCCGCTACYNICPKSCIKMEADFEGFKYPVINKDICIDCGLCEKVCPCLKEQKDEGEPIAYAVQNKNDSVLKSSTSGGFFTPLAEYVIANNGIVYGAAFDQEFNVVHKKCDKSNQYELSAFRGSKYVQSELGNTFFEIKSYLKQDKLVCFSGTPCQVEGLKAYLGKEYENLITVDFVCHGTPSPKLWNKYLDYQKNKYNSKIDSISFRNKTYGYHSGTMGISFKSGKTYFGSARVDYMLKSFFKEISSRPSCYKCHFKQLNHVCDMTIFDCWNVSKLVEGLKDEDKGYTNLFIHSLKGQEIFDEIKDCYANYRANCQSAVLLDGSMVLNSATPHAERNDYYKNIDNYELNEHIQKFIPISKKDYILENSKSVLYKLGLLKKVKKLKEN